MSKTLCSNLSVKSKITNSEALKTIENCPSNSKYIVDELNSEEKDYQTIMQAYTGSTIVGNYLAAPTKLYRVVEKGVPVKNKNEEPVEKKGKNLMLFHGTGCKGVAGILEKGYLSSESGSYGPGIYLTNCSNLAQAKSLKRNDENKSFVFVNEILSSKYLSSVPSRKKPVEKEKSIACKENTFQKYVDQYTKRIKKSDFIADSEGRKISKSSYKHEYYSDHSIFRAHENMVIPRYLVYSVYKKP